MAPIAGPLVSTIVLSYNQCRYILETLESVKAQTYEGTQLIIVDDCSTDDSVATIERWLGESRTPCSFIRHQKNQGICKSLNDALAAATGKYISMVASDDLWLPDKIARQVEIMESQPEQIGVLYSDAYQIDEHGNPLADMFIAAHRNLPAMPRGQILDVLLEGNFIPAMTTLIRRNCYQEVGLYDETLPWEDWDMWLRIARRYSFAYSPVPFAKYRSHRQSLSHSDRKAMLKVSVKIGLKQFGLGQLSENQKLTLIEMLLNRSGELYRQDGAKSAELLSVVWKATADGRARSMYRYAKWGLSYRGWRRIEVARAMVRDRFWQPILSATRPLRHALGLRQETVRPPLKK